MSKSETQIVIDVKLSSNHHDADGTTSIIIDTVNKSLFEGRSLFRKMPGGPLMIIRDASGNYLRRPNKEGGGVSLSSYIFGRVYMQRIDKQVTDDYTESAFKPNSGRYAQIDIHATPDSLPKGHLYKEEFLAEEAKREAEKAAKEPTDPSERLIREMSTLQRKVDRVRALPAGGIAKCPWCDKSFTKTAKLKVYCSSHSAEGISGCKDKANARKSVIRAELAALCPSKAVTTTKVPKVAPAVDPIVKKGDNVFKVIKGVSLTLEQTKALLFTSEDAPNFMEHKGVMFSLSEMRTILELEE